SVTGADELEDRLLLAAGELELGVAVVGGDDDQVVLADGGGFEDGGILTEGHLEPARVLQGTGKVECLVAVAVVLPLAAREQEDLGPSRGLLLGLGRLRQETSQEQAQADDGESFHESGSFPPQRVGLFRSVQRGSSGLDWRIATGSRSDRVVA